MKKWMYISAMAMAFVLALGGCSGSGSSGSAEAESAAGQASVAAESAAGGETAAAQEDKVWIVGTNAEFPPFEYVADNGEPDGFDIALIKKIGEKLGMEVQIENMEFNSIISSIGTKIDASISGMTITEERKQAVDFSDPYYEAVQYVIVGKDSAIAAAADLEGKTIGVQLGTTGGYLAEEIAGATVQTYNKAVDAVNDLVNGRVDAVIVDKNPAMVFASNMADKVTALPGQDFGFAAENYGIVLPKGSEMTALVNQALADLKADGTYDALVKQYIEEVE